MEVWNRRVRVNRLNTGRPNTWNENRELEENKNEARIPHQYEEISGSVQVTTSS